MKKYERYLVLVVLVLILCAEIMRLGVLLGAVPIQPVYSAIPILFGVGIVLAYTIKAWNKRFDDEEWRWSMILALCTALEITAGILPRVSA